MPRRSNHSSKRGPQGRTSSRIDLLDAKIIMLLQEDGRLPNTELARRIGVTEATVRKRVGRLLRDRVMLVGAWTDPLKIGYQTYAFIALKVDLARAEQVAERVARLPEVFFAVMVSGTYDILAGALFRSTEHMYECITRRLGRIPGIETSSTSIVLKTIKRGFSYPVVEHDADRPRQSAGRRGRQPRARMAALAKD